MKESLFLFSRFEYLKGTHQGLVHTHNSPRVIELSTIVRCTEYCHQLSLSEKLVPLLDYLMCPADEVNIQVLKELSYDVRAKDETDTSLVLAPSLYALLRV